MCCRACASNADLEWLRCIAGQLQLFLLDSHPVQHFSVAEPAPGSFSCEEFIQHHPVSVHIRTLAESAFQQQFWGHVRDGTVGLGFH